MVNQVYVEMLAYKIFLKQINPNTQKEFTVDDVKKEEYKNPVLEFVNKLKLESEAKKDDINA